MVEVQCNDCGCTGHKAEDCWERESNASKRPANWKSRKNNSNETANPNIDNGNVEMLRTSHGANGNSGIALTTISLVKIEGMVKKFKCHRCALAGRLHVPTKKIKQRTINTE